MKIPIRMFLDDLSVGHGCFRFNPQGKAKAGGFQSFAQRPDAVRIIPGTGKPIAAILPPWVGWISLGSERISIPAGVHSIEFHRNLVVVHPLDIVDLVVDLLRSPTAEHNRSDHRLAIVVGRIVREQKTPPDVLRILPVATVPVHKHDAWGANLLTRMKQQVRPLHPSRHRDRFPITGISEIGLPIAGPTDGSDQPVVAGLEIKKWKSVPAGWVSSWRFKVIACARA